MPVIRLSADWRGFKVGERVSLTNDEMSEAYLDRVVGKRYASAPPGKTPSLSGARKPTAKRTAKKTTKKTAPAPTE